MWSKERRKKRYDNYKYERAKSGVGAYAIRSKDLYRATPEAALRLADERLGYSHAITPPSERPPSGPPPPARSTSVRVWGRKPPAHE